MYGHAIVSSMLFALCVGRVDAHTVVVHSCSVHTLTVKSLKCAGVLMVCCGAVCMVGVVLSAENGSDLVQVLPVCLMQSSAAVMQQPTQQSGVWIKSC